MSAHTRFISIVIPALNEALTIGTFILWCKQGLADARVDGEILIIDSSTDNTAAIAASVGARVIKTSKHGLGQAYIDAMPHIRGDYVIMGDCDLTYDFREIQSFIEKLDAGYEFVMGTRMKGYIESGAMPFLHRYFGTPITTFILNWMYGSHYTDIHCGMRAMTLDALKKIHIESRSWEYASEMVLKAARLHLRTAEVPIRFYKDPEGRVSHHKRMGWFSPWFAGWINLKVMFLYAPRFFLMKPGVCCLLSGLLLVIALGIWGQILFFSTHTMLLGITLIVVGYSAVQLAILSDVIYASNHDAILRYKKIFSYDRSVIIGLLLMLVGIIIAAHFVYTSAHQGFILQTVSQSVLVGLLLIIVGFQTFTFTLVFNMIVHTMKKG